MSTLCEVDGTHTVSRPTWSLGGWKRAGPVLEHLCRLILCVAAMNQKKKFYFDLVPYCHEVLFLLCCGEPDHCFELAGRTKAPPCPGPRTGRGS